MLSVLALLGIALVGSFVVGNEEAEDSSTESGQDMNEALATDLLDNHLPLDAFDPPDGPQDLEVGGETVSIDGIEFDREFLESRHIEMGGDRNDLIDGNSDDLTGSADHIFGGSGDDHLIGGNGDVLVGGSGHDTFELGANSFVNILDLEDDELVVIQYFGNEPVITGDATDDGVSILANGYPVAHLKGVHTLNLSETVRLISVS